MGIVAANRTGTGTVAKALEQGAWTFGESGMDLEEDMDVEEYAEITGLNDFRDSEL